MNPNRRSVLKGMSGAALAAWVTPVTGAREAPALPALRKLAAGRPLIGVAVPTRFDTLFTAAETGLLESQFDSVTPENCMKWDQLCPEEGEYRFEAADRLVEYAGIHDQKVVGHCLLFNRANNYPDWVFRDGGKEADAKLVWQRIEAHVAKMMTRYKGRIHSWDVLNEFVEVRSPGYRETDFTRVLGPDYPERLLKLAAELDPRAKVTYNDFGIENPERRKAILAFVRSLQDRGCRVDVVGSQSHLELGDEIADQVATTIKECATLGIRCAFTELDVDVVSRKLYWNEKTRPEAIKQNPYVDGCPEQILEQQADAYRRLFEVVMENREHVDRVTLWGLDDGHSWLNNWPWKRVNHALLFDREARPKPAFHGVAGALAGS